MSQEKNSGRGLTTVQLGIESAIHNACRANFGVLDTNFLCRSVSILEPRKPLCVKEDVSVSTVVEQLRSNKVGCVLVTGEKEKLVGIFSERDVLTKVVGDFEANKMRPVREFMTRDPITQAPDATIGFVLNLMSSGGFRHMPILDGEGVALGVISIKDVVDFIVKSFTDDLLSFNTAEV